MPTCKDKPHLVKDWLSKYWMLSSEDNIQLHAAYRAVAKDFMINTNV